MSDMILKQCFFCEEWFPSDKVEVQRLQRHPSSSSEEVFVCEGCTKVSRTERLVGKAVRALNHGGFNEIEVTEGNLKVHLIRFTPAPYYPTPTIPPATPYGHPWY